MGHWTIFLLNQFTALPEQHTLASPDGVVSQAQSRPIRGSPQSPAFHLQCVVVALIDIINPVTVGLFTCRIRNCDGGAGRAAHRHEYAITIDVAVLVEVAREIKVSAPNGRNSNIVIHQQDHQEPLEPLGRNGRPLLREGPFHRCR